MLERRAGITRILEDIDPETLIVVSLGTPVNDVGSTGDRDLNFYLRGSMGCALSVALGLALAQPARRVLLICGDGELMMTLGALATAALAEAENLSVVVLDNERFGETGDQRSATAFGADIAAMAAGAGFRHAATISGENELGAAAGAIHTAPGPVLHVLKVGLDRGPRSAIPMDGVWIKNRFREALLGPDGVS